MSLSQRDFLTYVTTINGQNSGSVTHGFLIDIGNTANSATIDGFTITGCGNVSGGNEGGGVFVYQSSATIANCNFTSNNADYGGGLAGMDAVLTVTNCQFTSNNVAYYGGGASVRGNSEANFSDCTFYSNSGVLGGGGLSAEAVAGGTPTVTITDCTFEANEANGTPWIGRGGGIFTSEVSPTITNSLIIANSA